MATQEIIHMATDEFVVWENYIGASMFEFDDKPIFPEVLDGQVKNERVSFKFKTLPGVRWGQLWRSDEHSVDEHLKIGLKSTQQLRFLYDQYGLIFLDRSAGNTLVNNGDVYQIDLEAIFDTKSKSLLANGRRKWDLWLDQFQDDRITAKELSAVFRHYLEMHLDNCTRLVLERKKIIHLLEALEPFELIGGNLAEFEKTLQSFIS